MKAIVGVLCLSLVAGVSLALLPQPAPKTASPAVQAPTFPIMPFPAQAGCTVVSSCQMYQICDCDVPVIIPDQGCVDENGRDWKLAMCSPIFVCQTDSLC